MYDIVRLDPATVMSGYTYQVYNTATEAPDGPEFDTYDEAARYAIERVEGED